MWQQQHSNKQPKEDVALQPMTSVRRSFELGLPVHARISDYIARPADVRGARSAAESYERTNTQIPAFHTGPQYA